MPDDRLVRIFHEKTLIIAHLFGKTGLPVHRADRGHIGVLEQGVVVLPETGSGVNDAGPLFGGFEPFDQTKLQSLYRNHGTYVSRFTQAVKASERQGFLLREDAQTQRDVAAHSSVGK